MYDGGLWRTVVSHLGNILESHLLTKILHSPLKTQEYIPLGVSSVLLLPMLFAGVYS